jgi:hypothetical protein
MHFDLRTVMTLLAIINFAIAIPLAVFYFKYSRVKGLGYVILASLIQSLSVTLTLMRSPENNTLDFYLILFANGGHLIAFSIYYQTVRMYVGKKPQWLFPLILLTLILCYLALFSANAYLDYRIVVCSSGIALLCIMTFWVLHDEVNHQFGKTLLLCTFLLTALVCILRIYKTMYSGTDNVFYLAVTNSSMIFVWGGISSIWIAIGAMIVIMESSKQDVDQKIKVLEACIENQKECIQHQTQINDETAQYLKKILTNIKTNTGNIAVMRYGSQDGFDYMVRMLEGNISDLNLFIDELELKRLHRDSFEDM